jgi:hypothetical protein
MTKDQVVQGGDRLTPCNLGTCDADKPLRQMTRVEDVLDGQPIVGYGCTPEHGRQLALQWTSGDRYSDPDPMWTTVGNGRVVAA